jgi:RNA polymerase sigma-70 factor (ECF subfamily)
MSRPSRLAPLWPRRPGEQSPAVAPVDLSGEIGAGLSDDMLLAGFGPGDPAAALEFVRRFQRTAFSVALGVVGDAGLAEDVAQQGLARAWRHATQYDAGRGSVRGWLIRIVHNLAVDTVRIRRPYPMDQQRLDSLIEAMIETPERHTLAGETSAKLRAALAALPAEQARAAVLSAPGLRRAGQVAVLLPTPVCCASTCSSTAYATALRSHSLD